MRLRASFVVVVTGALVAFVALGTAGCPKTCVVDTDCPTGDVCGSGTCTSPCAADKPCPAGQACVERTDGTFEGACLAIADHKKTGDACASGQECSSGACIEKKCAAPCDGDVCPGGEVCTLADVNHVCLPPTGSLDPGDACKIGTDCKSGQCVEPPGVDHKICTAPCTSSSTCDAGDTCARLPGGAHTCIAPLANGTTCGDDTECSGGFCIKDVDNTFKCAAVCGANDACDDGFSCETAVDSNGDGKVDATDKAVCMPVLDTKADGETCEHARECAGLHCAHFNDGTHDFGTLCASPCDNGQCPSPEICWPKDPSVATSVDVCGPTPPP